MRNSLSELWGDDRPGLTGLVSPRVLTQAGWLAGWLLQGQMEVLMLSLIQISVSPVTSRHLSLHLAITPISPLNLTEEANWGRRKEGRGRLRGCKKHVIVRSQWSLRQARGRDGSGSEGTNYRQEISSSIGPSVTPVNILTPRHSNNKFQLNYKLSHNYCFVFFKASKDFFMIYCGAELAFLMNDGWVEWRNNSNSEFPTLHLVVVCSCYYNW